LTDLRDRGQGRLCRVFLQLFHLAGQHGLYLEDLYITPDARGHGAGKALLQHLARIAMEKDCGRFEWSCLDWNTPSIKFYDSLGALPQTEGSAIA
jgi:GNAT superfamily N-acetyltransferase